MTHTEGLVWCDNCGVEITWAAIVQVGRDHHRLLHYCCQDCLEGRGCDCGRRLEEEDEMQRQSASYTC